MKPSAILASFLLSAMPLIAQPVSFVSDETPTTFIELFTSEGCSSCPPADAWMSTLKTSPDLWKKFVPVAFHVDYWDRLGWPDRFASAANTARQRRYAASWRSNSVYTPGFVLNGREWRDWSSHAPLTASGSEKVGKLQITLRDRIHADVIFTPARTAPKPLQVEVALLGGNLESDVKRGENSGRKLRHEFVVLHLATAALTAEGNRFAATLALPEKTIDTPVALAAWIVAGGGQPPLQATGGWLKTP
ncbi:MAG: DUF1223 domain-containing protein [Chthoniobacteraceae bacterium]